MVGNIPHEKMQQYYQSADIFVSASHSEGSGYSLSEALRCGCLPIVTDIPSFRMMTDDGNLGGLWTAGLPGSLVNTFMQHLETPYEERGLACINFFKENLSIQAIGKIAAGHYRDLLHKQP